MQTHNPMGFFCAPNAATPEYIAYTDFNSWLGYGLMTCWFGNGTEPGEQTNFPRIYDRDDVQELRSHFLDLVETVVATLWNGDYQPGDGEIDGDWQSVNINRNEDDHDKVLLTWYPRLDKDAILFELECTGSSGVGIWLSYEAIENRRAVLDAMVEARHFVGSDLWLGLILAAVSIPPEWKTETVENIASIGRRDHWPILADALEEAGCTSAELLLGLRTDTPSGNDGYIQLAVAALARPARRFHPLCLS